MQNRNNRASIRNSFCITCELYCIPSDTTTLKKLQMGCINRNAYGSIVLNATAMTKKN